MSSGTTAAGTTTISVRRESRETLEEEVKAVAYINEILMCSDGDGKKLN